MGPRLVPAVPARRDSVFSLVAKLAIAAAIVIAAALGLWSRRAGIGGGWGPASLNQVCQATQKMAWLHAVVTEYRDGVVRTDQQWNDFAGRKAYILTSDKTAVVSDFGAGRRELLYSPQIRAVVISDLPSKGLFGADSAYTLIDSFAVFAAKDDVEVARWTEKYEGKKVLMYELEKADPGATVGGRRVERLLMRLMADPETRRLVGAHIESRRTGTGSGTLLSRQEWVVSYPQSGPMSIYDLGVPETARIVDRTSQATGTPPQDPRPIGTPEDLGRSTLMPLEIILPRPLFIGTPADVRVPNLERPRGGARPPFLVPLGTTNVALGKPVSSSDPAPVIGSLEMITDGDKEGTDGSIVELGPGMQQVTIDLQDRYEIYAIAVWHYHLRPHVYQDVVVQVCDDPSATGGPGVETVFNNDTDNSSGLGQGADRLYIETNEGKLIDTQGVEGRYVCLFSSGHIGSDINHYIEVQVYGRPAR